MCLNSFSQIVEREYFASSLLKEASCYTSAHNIVLFAYICSSMGVVAKASSYSCMNVFPPWDDSNSSFMNVCSLEVISLMKRFLRVMYKLER